MSDVGKRTSPALAPTDRLDLGNTNPAILEIVLVSKAHIVMSNHFSTKYKYVVNVEY